MLILGQQRHLSENCRYIQITCNTKLNKPLQSESEDAFVSSWTTAPPAKRVWTTFAPQVEILQNYQLLPIRVRSQFPVIDNVRMRRYGHNLWSEGLWMSWSLLGNSLSFSTFHLFIQPPILHRLLLSTVQDFFLLSVWPPSRQLLRLPHIKLNLWLESFRSTTILNSVWVLRVWFERQCQQVTSNPWPSQFTSDVLKQVNWRRG